MHALDGLFSLGRQEIQVDHLAVHFKVDALVREPLHHRQDDGVVLIVGRAPHSRQCADARELEKEGAKHSSMRRVASDSSDTSMILIKSSLSLWLKPGEETSTLFPCSTSLLLECVHIFWLNSNISCFTVFSGSRSDGIEANRSYMLVYASSSNILPPRMTYPVSGEP